MTLHDVLRTVGELGVSFLRWVLSALAVALVLALADAVKRRIWPPREDPDRRAQAEAWAALIAEAEERTRERHPRDPHVLALEKTPEDSAPEGAAETSFRRA